MTRPNPDDVVQTLDAVGTAGCKATVQQYTPTSSHGGMRAVMPSDNPDTWVSFGEYAKLQSLLIAAREEADRRTRELELTYVVQRDLRLRAERAEAEIAECRRDTERYRWLRKNPAWESEAFLSGLSPTQFDAAIDACVGGEESK